MKERKAVSLVQRRGAPAYSCGSLAAGLAGTVGFRVLATMRAFFCSLRIWTTFFPPVAAAAAVATPAASAGAFATMAVATQMGQTYWEGIG